MALLLTVVTLHFWNDTLLFLGSNISELLHTIINPKALQFSFFPYQFCAILSLSFLFSAFYFLNIYIHNTLAFTFPINNNPVFFQTNIFTLLSYKIVAIWTLSKKNRLPIIICIFLLKFPLLPGSWLFSAVWNWHF